MVVVLVTPTHQKMAEDFLPARRQLLRQADSHAASFDIGSVGLMREFVEHFARTRSGWASGGRPAPAHAVDWTILQAAVAGSASLEQAVGRALVIAEQMCRGVFEGSVVEVSPLPEVVPAARTREDTLSVPNHEHPFPTLSEDDPFFAFNMADAIPDFGDESRYRTKVAKKVARVFGMRVMAPSAVAS